MSTTGTATQPTGTAPAPTTQVYRVYIKAAPQAVWDAITAPEWTTRYGYGGLVDYSKGSGEYQVRPDEAMIEGAKQMGFPIPDVVVDGEILEYDPPRKLALTWRMAMDPEMVVGSDAADTVGQGGGGWSWVLSDLKSLLETGEPFTPR